MKYSYALYSGIFTDYRANRREIYRKYEVLLTFLSAVIIIIYSSKPSYSQLNQEGQEIVESVKPFMQRYRACAYPAVIYSAKNTNKAPETIMQEVYSKCAHQRQSVFNAMSKKGLKETDMRQVDTEIAGYLSSWITKARENK